jgi:hypothetical protein
MQGAGAAIGTAVVVARCNNKYWHILGVSVQNFTQLGGHADFYALLFGVLYLAWCDF